MFQLTEILLSPSHLKKVQLQLKEVQLRRKLDYQVPE
jgi:hypothetical protein